MSEWWRQSAVETAAAIRDQRVNAEEVVESHLERLEAVNPAVNAVTVRMDDAAREAARVADRAISAGTPLGPLHGVPVTIKENIDQRGHATTNGVEAFTDVMAEQDSPVVANLERAGAVIIGRTNTPEFSLRWFTDNPLRGATLNPWDRSVTPGGSSGGAAAALSVGIGCIAHGNDLGGSLRYPAYACGLATIRPTLGRVPAYNPTQPEERTLGVQLMSVQGPIARTVADVRLALEAMAARDMRDPWWVPTPHARSTAMAEPIKVAVTVDPSGLGVNPRVAEAVQQAAGALSNAGYEVAEVEPPNVAEVAELWKSVLFTETRLGMETAIRTHGSAVIRRTLDHYHAGTEALDLAGYARALADRSRVLRDWLTFLEDYPLVLGPVSTEPPFPAGEDQVSPERTAEILCAQRLLIAVNLLGLPAACVPTGVAGGVPLGVQIIGSRYDEALTLDAAQAIEADTGVLCPIDPR